MSHFERYIASGGRRTGFWRVLVGAAVIGTLWVASTGLVVLLWSMLNVVRYGSAGAEHRLAGMMQGGSPETVMVVLLTFAGVWAGVYLVLRLLHGQRFSTLFAPEGGFRAGDFGKGLLLAGIVSAVSIPLALAIAGPTEPALPVSVWLGYVLPIFALVFVQATAEELIFRGYLLQQLALRSRNPLVWAGIPSAIFGVMHWSGTLPLEAQILYVATTLVMGLALAALVWRTGSLWAAIGVHVGFNAIGLTVVGSDGVLSGAQLLLFSSEDLIPLMRTDLAATVVLLALFVSRWSPFGPPAGPAEARL